MTQRRLDNTLELAFGRFTAQALEGASGVDEDPLLAQWVRRIGAQVAAQSPRDDLPPRYAILGSDVANAMAIPGSQVYVTRGLLDSITTDDELAGVLAHETAHVAKRHAWQQLLTNGLVGLGLQVLRPHSRELRTGATVYNLLRTLKKSREHEDQADAIGLGYAAAAGYDPNGLVRFIENLGGGATAKWEEYFSTHPTAQHRTERCRKSALVSGRDDAARAALAAGLQERGFHAVAAQTRRGTDPLALPPLPIVPVPPELASERQELVQQAEQYRKRLGGFLPTVHAGSVLQQVLLITLQPNDIVWLALATHAYTVTLQVQDIFARTSRVLAALPGVWDGLVPSQHPDPAEGAIGRGEVRTALQHCDGVPVPLRRAANAATAVLTDLNAGRLYRLTRQQQWLRYGTLEGLLRYAESELRRADLASGKAWRFLSVARIRRYEARLNRLAPASQRAANESWQRLARQRLGTNAELQGPAGTATFQAALQLQMGKPLPVATSGYSADLVRAIGGVPENIATVMRLLTLDLEREQAASQPLPSPPKD